MEYESNETLGGIVNRTKALLLVKNKEDDALNPTTTQDRRHQKKEKKQNHNDRENEHLRIVAQRRWATVLVTLAVLFFVIQSSLVFVINYAIHPSVPTPNTNKLFGEFQFPLADIVQDTVPFVQDWFQKRQTGVMQNPSKKNGDNMVLLDNAQVTSTASIPSENTAPLTNVTNTSSCLKFYFQGMKEFIPTTSPSYVRLVLQNFGGSMYRSPRIQEALHDLLTEPQDLQAMYEESQKCLSDNQPFVALACVASDFVAPPNLTDVETKIVFQYLVNFSAVLEALTMFLEKDFQALNEMVEAMVTSRRKEFELYVEEKYAENSADYEFSLAKYQTMSVTAQYLLDSKAQNRISVSENIDDNKLMQLNILEAVKLDLKYRREENARAGLALAATAKVGNYMESHDFLNQLSKEWIDGYIAWNFVFVLTATEAKHRLGKLLIPSISCTGDLYVKERFIQRRVISLALSLVHMYAPPQDVEITRTAIQDTITPKEASILQLFYDDFGRENTMFSDDEHPLAGALGQSNIENIILTDPDQETVWKMLYNVCGEICHGPSWKITDSGLTSILFDETDDFYIYLGFINWISVVCTGIGLEVFMVLFVLKNGWTTAHEKQWKVAQILFPILALVTLGLASARNYLSLLTLVIGCWKFGFPETVAPMYCALFDTHVDKIKRISLALDSTGNIVHHSAASLVICMLVTGSMTPDRFVFDPILILCIQHWFVLLHDYHKLLYMVIQVLLEIWFEWTVLSNFEHYASNHWTAEVAASGMLLAHWIWLVSASLSLVTMKSRTRELKKFDEEELSTFMQQKTQECHQTIVSL